MRGGRPFALGTFADGDSSFSGLVLGDQVFGLESTLGSDVSVRRLLESWDDSFGRLQEIADAPEVSDGRPLAELRPLPPVLPPGQIFQAGANYRQHVLDLMAAAERRGDESDGLTSDEARKRARVELEARLEHGRPFVFLGSGHGMVGALDDVVLPHDSQQHDWELELAAVIGRPARRVTRDAALDVVAGYTICNDLTTRDALSRTDTRMLGLDWLAGKNAPTFLPTGPLFVPAAHAGDVTNLNIRLSVNGRVMQNESTAEMVFGVAELIEHISAVSQLRPGDLVLTGSPSGNGASHGVFLQPGDVIEGTIAGLGTQRNHCVAEEGHAGGVERDNELVATTQSRASRTASSAPWASQSTKYRGDIR